MRIIALVVFVIGVACVGQAQAGVYDVTYTANSIVTDLTVTTSDAPDPNWSGGYDILSVTGMRGAASVTGLIPTSAPGVVTAASVGTNPIQFDNVFYPVDLNFDLYGLFFATAADDYNLYFEGGQYYELTPEQKDAGSLGSAVSGLSVAAVPEPNAWALLLLGFGVTMMLSKATAGGRKVRLSV
jgi:hypothetical protein